MYIQKEAILNNPLHEVSVTVGVFVIGSNENEAVGWFVLDGT